MRKMAKNGSNKEGRQKSDGLRVPSSRRGEALPQKDYVRDYEGIVQHA